MKIAYLLHTERDYEEIIEITNQLIKQGDHVFMMINDNSLRDKISFVYADDLKVHISHTQEFAQEGDLSLARGTIIQIKEALDIYAFDYFINLTDSMLPIKTRSEIVSYLEEHSGKDFYYIDRNEDPQLRKKAEKYYTFTNLLAFPTSKFVRGITKATASVLSSLGIRRKLKDSYIIGSPWFILTNESAQKLAAHYDYVSTTFKLSWYPEEMYIPMMMKKFVYDTKEDDHINNDLRIIGPNGSWEESSGAKPITEELLEQHPEALFAAKINTTDNLYLFERYFDKYNQDYLQEEELQKEKEFIDPEILRDAMNRYKSK